MSVRKCPNCGNDYWMMNNGLYVCNKCGHRMPIEDMQKTQRTFGDEIVVPINGGKILAGRNTDLDYPGVSICYETEHGDLIDIVTVEAHPDENKKDIHVYCYEDVVTEDWTHKFVIRKANVDKVLGLE